MKKILLGTVAAAVVLMIWGIIYWAVSPAGFWVMKGLPNAEAVVPSLGENLGETGVYLYPWATPEEMQADGGAAWSERHRQGPLLQIFYRKEGTDPLGAKTFLAGFVHYLASALIVAVLLQMALPALDSYGKRVLFVFLIGMLAGVSVELAKPIWWHQPWGYHTFNAVYAFSAWLLAAFVMAWIQKPVDERRLARG